MRTRQFFASAGAVALVATGLIAGGGATAAAADAPANPAATCAVNEALPTHLSCTVSYASTGAEQTFTAPVGVTSVDVELIGGGGGDAFFAVGGSGDRLVGSYAVSSSATLYVYVGGNGSYVSGGFNGGGSPGTPVGSARQAGGGGATDIRTLPATDTGSLASRVAVAGGGGGGAFGRGGDAGQPGSGDGSNQGGGGAGTQSAGGAGGAFASYNSGASGTLGTGGVGGNYNGSGTTASGGGGGGGYYGGGGGVGNASGGGGGGSSLLPSGWQRGLSENSPVARFTYDVPIAAVEVGAPQVAALQSTQVTATARAMAPGHSADVTSRIVSVQATGSQYPELQASDVTCTGVSCTSIRAGHYIARAEFGQWRGPVDFALAFTLLGQSIDFTGGSSDVQQPMQLTATATSGLPVSYTLDSGPCTLNGSTLAATGTGTCTVTAAQPGANPYLAAKSVTRSFNATPPVVPSNGHPNSLANTGQAEGTGAMTAAAALALMVLGAGLILARRKTVR